MYCRKQVQMRHEQTMQSKIKVFQSNNESELPPELRMAMGAGGPQARNRGRPGPPGGMMPLGGDEQPPPFIIPPQAQPPRTSRARVGATDWLQLADKRSTEFGGVPPGFPPEVRPSYCHCHIRCLERELLTHPSSSSSPITAATVVVEGCAIPPWMADGHASDGAADTQPAAELRPARLHGPSVRR